MFAKACVFTLSVLILLGLAFVAMGQNLSPAAAVASFYRYDRSHSQIVDRQTVDARRPWLSPGLYEMFRKELRDERVYLSKNPEDKPFFGDGFPFQPVAEPCSAGGRSFKYLYSVGPAAIKRNKAHVTVRFFYPKPCEARAIIYTIEMTRTGNKWLINDLIYDDKSRLTDEMKKPHY
jgi:hypothetical protein